MKGSGDENDVNIMVYIEKPLLERNKVKRFVEIS